MLLLRGTTATVIALFFFFLRLFLHAFCPPVIVFSSFSSPSCLRFLLSFLTLLLFAQSNLDNTLLLLFTMGLFKRKDSKQSIHSDKDEQDSYVSVNSARTSNASLKSPGNKGGSGLPTAIPELPIARPPDPVLDPAAYLRSIHAVRTRCSLVHQRAKRNQLNHFTVDMTKFAATASYIVSIIKVSKTERGRENTRVCHLIGLR